MRNFNLPDDAVALQPVRFISDDELRYYTATTFPNNPRGGCQVYLSRCAIAGGITESQEEAVGICDVLNSDSEIVADVYLTKKGLAFLYEKLNCRVIPEQEGR